MKPHFLYDKFIFIKFLILSGMWSARDKKEGKSDHAPSHAHKQATPPAFIKNIYFSTLKDISYTVRIHTIVL